MEQDTGYSVFPHNTCKYRKGCRRKKVCGTSECKHPLVPTCRQCELLCNRYCEHFEEEVCTHRFKPPYVCNGCREVKKCTLTKTIYSALEAQRKATAKISESRSGILSTEGEIARLNEILVPLVKQGQGIHQIYLNNKDELMCSTYKLVELESCSYAILEGTELKTGSKHMVLLYEKNEAKEQAKYFKEQYGNAGMPLFYKPWNPMETNWKVCIGRNNRLYKRLVNED